jgi:hypothetical protein
VDVSHLRTAAALLKDSSSAFTLDVNSVSCNCRSLTYSLMVLSPGMLAEANDFDYRTPAQSAARRNAGLSPSTIES